ncbi:ubiquitin thioesterase zranb1-A-like [Tubulanus polymorphus]|uniref:ubiquitin thioesterase zranb1-A-like n=1 Tax=Tubulanus polymorphus TaxID=672921 RepID=UPI003DA55E61
MEGSEGQKWSCEYCTYENWPVAKKCTLCHAPRPLQLISQAVSDPEQDIYKLAPLLTQDAASATSTSSFLISQCYDPTKKWSCPACTYLNWPRSQKCVQCMTARQQTPTTSEPSSTTASNEQQLSPLSINVNITPSGSPGSRHSSPSSPEAAKELNNDRNRLVALKQGKWTCRACTYDNWPKSNKCVICATHRGRQFEAGAAGGHSPRIISPDFDEQCSSSSTSTSNNRQSESRRRQSPTRSIRSAESPEIYGATAAPRIIQEDNNITQERKLKQIRNRLRKVDWLWLNACKGVIDGDVHAVEAYLTSGGNPARQLTNDEISLLGRPSAYEIGYTLVHLAIRYQREDTLAVLLTSTDTPSKAIKRVPSHVSPDLAADIRRDVAGNLRQRKGDFPCYFVTDLVTFALPAEIEDLPRPIQKQLFEELLDSDVQKELEVEEPIINWSVELTDRLGSRLYALWNRTAGDCLLDSVLQATWGIFDRDNTLRRTLADSLCDGAATFYPRWKEFESMQAQSLQFTLDESQWERDWAILLSLATQPGASLEQTHIFALAHILRRPIIVYGVKFVKSFRGDAIGFARFQGIYLPILWESSFCWKTPITLGYTRGHFSALVPLETDNDRNIGASCNLDGSTDQQITYLPLMDSEGKLLPIHFLSASQLGKEETIMHEWMDCCQTTGGLLVAQMKVGKKPGLVRQMIDEWLDFYRRLSHVVNNSQSSAAPVHTLSSDGESEDE